MDRDALQIRNSPSIYLPRKRHLTRQTFDYNEKILCTDSTSIFLKEVEEEKGNSVYKAKLRHKKAINYTEHLDILSSEDNCSNSISKSKETAVQGTTTLPNNEQDIEGIIKKCDEKINKLQEDFLKEEHKEESTFSFKS